MQRRREWKEARREGMVEGGRRERDKERIAGWEGKVGG